MLEIEAWAIIRRIGIWIFGLIGFGTIGSLWGWSIDHSDGPLPGMIGGALIFSMARLWAMDMRDYIERR